MHNSVRLDESATLVVEMTPPGRGAVAVVLVAGPDAVRAVDAAFTSASGRTITVAPLQRILLGKWGGSAGEELIVCRRTANEVEVHCHGGTAAVRAVVERLIGEGCRETDWRDWVWAIEVDPIRAAARIALATAPTERTCRILLDQYQGALLAAVGAIRAAVDESDWHRAAAAISALRATVSVGQHLTSPWQVVLAGRPNVGKSSLINALAGYPRAIVSHVPGTTRDIVTTATAIDGWPVQLADTAGLRATTDALESAGVALARAALAQADLVILVHDAGDADSFAALPGTATEIGATIKPPQQLLQVVNKIDLLTTEARRHWQSKWQALFGGAEMLATSAITGEGIPALLSAISRTLVPNPPERGAAVLFTAEQNAAMEDARRAIERRDQAAALASLQALLVQ